MLKKKLFNEHGALIIEASVVFPIMFLVIFMMIFAGNIYYQKSCVESFVTEGAIKGAAYCADPLLVSIDQNGAPPALSDNFDIQPYRFFFDGDMPVVENEIKKEIKGKIDDMGSGFFGGMKPEHTKVKAKYDGNIVSATFVVSAECEIPLGIRMLWSSEVIKIGVYSRSEMPVSNAPEFVRVVDMAGDYLNEFGVTDYLTKAVDTIKGWFSSKE